MKSSAIWQGEPQRIDRAVFELGLTRSRTQAAEYVATGYVYVNDVLVKKTGLQVTTGARIEVDGGDHYVSRAAHKLISGLDVFDIDPSGNIAVDLGASTGGFTQVLLERGAKIVVSIDVGHDQMGEALRDHPQVRVVEGCNARELTHASLVQLSGISDHIQLVVGDLSFISLNLILPAIARFAPKAQLVLLIKPQFEVGRHGIKHGIVSDTSRAVKAISDVLSTAESLGFYCAGLSPSPIAGEYGNREILAFFRVDPLVSPVDQTEWNRRIQSLVESEELL